MTFQPDVTFPSKMFQLGSGSALTEWFLCPFTSPVLSGAAWSCVFSAQDLELDMSPFLRQWNVKLRRVEECLWQSGYLLHSPLNRHLYPSQPSFYCYINLKLIRPFPLHLRPPTTRNVASPGTIYPLACSTNIGFIFEIGSHVVYADLKIII